MNLKVAASLALAIITAPGLALAAPQTWYVHHGDLIDAGATVGVVTGSFDYDADNDTFSNINLEYRTPSNVLIETYDDTFTPAFTPNSPSRLNAYPSGQPAGHHPAILIWTTSAMTTAPGTLALDTGGSKVYTCDTVGVQPCNAAVGSLYFAPGAVISTSAAPPPVAPPASVPTMTEWAMILLTAMLGGFAVLTLQRRRQAR